MVRSRCAVASLLVVASTCLLPATLVHAQAVSVDHLLTRDVSAISSSPAGVNGSRWITRGDPDAAVLNDNTIQWLFNAAPIIWRDDPKYAMFQYDEFTSFDATRRNLYLSTFSGSNTRLGIQHATFSNVTFKPQTVTLETLGTLDDTDRATSWTLDNSRIEGNTATPVFYGDQLALTTIGAQQSELYGFWPGFMNAQTAMVVSNPGGLLMSRMGEIGSGPDAYYLTKSGNTYDVDGTTLAIRHSYLRLMSGRNPTVTSGTVTEGFVVRNGATLSLSGADSSDSYTRVEIGPMSGLAIDNSSLSLADNAQLSFLGTTARFLLTNATVTMGDYGTQTAVTGNVDAVFSGSNAINTSTSNPNYGFSTGIVLSDSNAVLTINGRGIVVGHGDQVGDGLPMNGGSINVTGSSALQLVDVIDVQTAGSLTIADPLSRFLFPSKTHLGIPSTLYLRDTGGDPLRVTNNGTMAIEGTLVASGTIAGSGVLQMNGMLKLEPGESQFTVAGNLWLQTSATSQFVVDPTALTSQHLAVAGLTLGEVVGPIVLGLPKLSLSLANDAVVPEGTKFLLIDYATRTDSNYIFDGLPDGSIFQSGLNLYQILYADPAYSSTAVTLTVVPEPSATVALAAATAMSILARRGRRATTPTSDGNG